ncbi:hypothetical protein L21SP5_03646 [Salinivirga cyanobacteriivorans]|uniref:Uncharacterized protein n=1 Tax=Salinivirga cyanobacteriivorans TaxID=1307839 RepID=A0A0S2I4I0_9BACT|nr:hypothetical protein [Salinivirga cyanobacteriivorans]ALO17247.1 hypothetical protein L21SP5_03646 [Salinivirga cyanobacteriivorans]
MNIKEIVLDMTSRDLHRIRKSGTEIINNSQNEDQIKKLFPYRDEIYESTRNLRFTVNNVFYEFPIVIIDHHIKLKDNQGGICSCDLYLGAYSHFDPNVEKNNESMAFLVKGIGDYTHVYGLQCKKCDKRYHVSERHYHYIWYKWELMTKDIKDPIAKSEIEKVLKLYLDTLLSDKNLRGGRLQ